MDNALFTPDTEPFSLDELARTEKRFDADQAQAIKQFGYGETEGALAIAEKVLPRLTEAVKAGLEKPVAAQANEDRLLRVLKGLLPEVIALSGLQAVFHSIGAEQVLRDTLLGIGRTLSRELWGAGLTAKDERLSTRIERTVRQRHGSLKYRQQAARSLAKRAGFTMAHWSVFENLAAGRWLLDIMLQALPDVLVLDTEYDNTTRLTITEGALEIAERAAAMAMKRATVFLPTPEPPRPWTGWSKGGPIDPRVAGTATVLRSVHRETAGLVNAAIASGQMKPALDALNAIQNTAWRINERMLDIVTACAAHHIPVPGLPRFEEYPLPAKSEWEAMTEQEQTVWKIRASGVKRANRGLKSDRLAFSEDVACAQAMLDLGTFYVPHNCDWRGRVYALPHFNFQREDRVRALFLFEHGEPIGEEGLTWLKIHVANCGDFGKVSKKAFSDRVKWVDENLPRLLAASKDPFADLWWTKADKPFLFLAACVELASAHAEGSAYVTRLPVSWDGSCSGLQHLCAMTRATEGEFVNLTPSPTPQDVYQRVADAAAISIMEDAGNDNELARCVLHNGVDRSKVKRNVMTYTYASKKFGMAQQLKEDLMQPLSLQVLAGELAEHPYGADEGLSAAKYLAAKTYESIESIVHRPAKAMAFLQKIARALAHEGKPVSWTTPTGIPWVNRYYEVSTKRVKLFLHDRGVKLRYDLSVASGFSHHIDKTRAANAVAPNFVHALDAAHLMLVVLAAAKEGMRQFALVHDSFGCLASQSARFHKIIREQFVLMYEQHDVLAEVLERAKCDLTEHNRARLPEPVEYGALNLKDVLDAKYAFA